MRYLGGKAMLPGFAVTSEPPYYAADQSGYWTVEANNKAWKAVSSDLGPEARHDPLV
jgi:hypothetical protein